MSESILASWSPQARAAAELARRAKAEGASVYKESKENEGESPEAEGDSAAANHATEHARTREDHKVAVRLHKKAALSQSKSGAGDSQGYHENMADTHQQAVEELKGNDKMVVQAKRKTAVNTISAIFDRLNPVNLLIKAGAPLGNKNAAGKIGEHDLTRFKTKTPEAFKAHTDSMQAYVASEKAADSGTAEDHHAAMAAHFKAQESHQNTDWMKMSKSERTERTKNISTHRTEAFNHAEERDRLNPPAAEKFSSKSWKQANRDKSIASGSDD